MTPRKILVAAFPAVAGVAAGALTSLLMQPDAPPPADGTTEIRYVEVRPPDSTGAPAITERSDGGVGHRILEPVDVPFEEPAADPGTTSPGPTGDEMRRTVLASHDAEPVDYAWARNMNWALDAAIVPHLEALHASGVGAADCRTSTCAIELEWPDYQTAQRYVLRAVGVPYEGLDCGTFISLPDEEANASPVHATLVLQCRE